MNIGFEAKRVFMNFTGLGNYGRFIVDALTNQFPDNEYYLYTPRANANSETSSLTGKRNVHVVKPDGIFSQPGFSSIWRSWAVASHKSIDQLSLFHGLSQELPVGMPEHVKKVVTVHDLIFLRYPKFYNPIDVQIYTAKVKKACEIADVVVAVSEQTAEDVSSFLKIARDRIRIVYQGAHPAFKKHVTADEIESVKKKYSLPENYILNVGTIEERKNLHTLIKALGIIPKDSRPPLVVLGRKTKYFSKVQDEVMKADLADQIFFVDHAAFSDFPAIYCGSQLLAYPSLFEGFGIPIVEAIECSVPVITSTGSCFSEAGGADAIYVNPSALVT